MKQTVDSGTLRRLTLAVRYVRGTLEFGIQAESEGSDCLENGFIFLAGAEQQSTAATNVTSTDETINRLDSELNTTSTHIRPISRMWQGNEHGQPEHCLRLVL